MLRRSHRVTTKLFEEVMKRGRVIHSPLFVVRVLKDASGTTARVGAVAPVKIAKTSVARHRIRRRVYEAARPLVASLPEDAVIIFFAKQSMIDVDLANIRTAIRDIFVKAGLLR